MQPGDDAAFKQLFRDACRRCFRRELSVPLSATESKFLCAEVLSETGAPIAWRTVQQHSLWVHLEVAEESRQTGPTGVMLEALARYVAAAGDAGVRGGAAAASGAAATPGPTEGDGGPAEGPYPFWFRYKEAFHRDRLPAVVHELGLPDAHLVPRGLAKRFFFHTFRGAEQFILWGKLLVPERIRHSWLAWLAFLLLTSLAVVWGVREYYARKTNTFTDTFTQVAGDSLYTRGWMRVDPDSTWWNRRTDNPGALTLFTLQGDNWPDSSANPWIGNLLLRPLGGDCFTAEVQFSGFTPTANWQQAGLLLMEDTSLRARSVRISIAYNDYFEDYVQPRQIIVEGVSSASDPNRKPEEFLHKTLYLLGWGKDSLIYESMHHTALRIEKRGTSYRFLYAGGQTDNFIFQEVGSRSIYFTPRYIALFALKGFGRPAQELPVQVRFFSVQTGACEP
ncbi:DUF1349 domain-containing protein [Dinghuibacter silviterrae]|uniref:Uncharacterized protein n=1 Tax=Dinghuibacter silviterrae TaxID=1539049 RepID=A0A4R8DVE1_9BACT|nr:hypothetical protein [Dinghuibacter silviterrae]TDX02394.1 hypothetical protein EDB95_3452 [Dinghuibacter silviterrae]